MTQAQIKHLVIWLRIQFLVKNQIRKYTAAKETTLTFQVRLPT
jgi:hypothetical protein